MNVVPANVKAVLVVSTLLGAVSMAWAAPPAQPRWVGVYTFTESHPGPENTAIIIEHRIRVAEKNKTLSAELHSEGYQNPGTTLLCRVKATDSRLTLLFRSYPDGKTLNRFGVQHYKPGTALLTLRRETRNGKTRLLTDWAAYQAAAGDAVKSGRVAFVKAK